MDDELSTTRSCTKSESEIPSIVSGRREDKDRKKIAVDDREA